MTGDSADERPDEEHTCLLGTDGYYCPDDPTGVYDRIKLSYSDAMAVEYEIVGRADGSVEIRASDSQHGSTNQPKEETNVLTGIDASGGVVMVYDEDFGRTLSVQDGESKIEILLTTEQSTEMANTLGPENIDMESDDEQDTTLDELLGEDTERVETPLDAEKLSLNPGYEKAPQNPLCPVCEEPIRPISNQSERRFVCECEQVWQFTRK